MITVLKIGFLVLVSILLVLAAGIGWVAGTSAGAAWALDQVSSLTARALSFENVSGAAFQELHVDHLRWDKDGHEVDVYDLSLSVDLWKSLVGDAVVVDSASAAQVRYNNTNPPSDEPFSGTVSLPGLPIALDLKSVALGKLELGAVAGLAPEVLLRGKWLTNLITVESFRINDPALIAEGALRVGTGEDGAISGTIQWSYATVERLASGVLQVDGTLNNMSLDHVLNTPLAATTKATLSLATAKLPQIEAETEIAIYEIEQARAEKLEVYLIADQRGYQGSIRAQVHSDVRHVIESQAAAISGELDARFTGDFSHFAVSGFQLLLGNAATGRLNGSGRVEFGEVLAVTANLSGNQVNVCDLGGIASCLLDFTGEVGFRDGAIQIPQLSIDGTWEGQPLQFRGVVSGSGRNWRTEEARVSIGDNRMSGYAALQDGLLQASADYDLTALQLVSPLVSGDAVGTFSLTGPIASLDDMAFKVRLKSNQLDYSGLHLVDVEASVDGALMRPTRIELAIGELGKGPIKLGSVALKTSGPTARSQSGELGWTLEERRGDIAFALQVDPAGAVSLSIDEGSDVALPFETWTLDTDLIANTSPKGSFIKPHCWRRPQANGRICVDAFNLTDADNFDLAGDLNDVPASIIDLLVPGAPLLGGIIHATWQIRSRAGDLSGKAELRTKGLSLRSETTTKQDTDPSDDTEKILLPELIADMLIERSLLSATVQAVNASGGVSGAIRMSLTDPDAPIAGGFKLNVPDLGFVQSFTPQVGDLAGQISGDVVVGGTMKDPTIAGGIALDLSRMDLVEPRVGLRDVNLFAALENNQVNLTGTAASPGGGSLTLAAQMTDIFSEQRRTTGTLTSHELKVEAPDLALVVTSDLKLSWIDSGPRLSGEISIPSANVELTELPASTVQRSPDVVVVGRQNTQRRSNLLALDVQLLLGSEVFFKGYGIQTKVTGDLRLRQPHGSRPELQGQVRLREGKYGAFGQKLNIEYGALVFSGSPANPNVDARAVRRISNKTTDVTVGVRIQGPLRNMKTELFSEPTMAESQMLSYLVLGRPIEDATAQDIGQLSGVVLALGLTNAIGIITDIRETLGLQELSASTEDNEITLVAGKQINDRIFVRYVYQAYAQISSLVVRFDINDRLSVEATSSRSPGVDFIYRIDDR
ncbi:MAG: translocation/assembly module TamB domain-containing protein [Proteobacteria bacterium]|nr:translocation/assembly module TamB domain-containing protein [Pseudomonadota bacterium]